MARRPYTTTVRPFRDSDRTVRIRWYPARLADGTLPFPSRICSHDWMTRPWEAEGVGEVYGESRNFNRAKPLVGPRTDHVCGDKEDFELGEVLNETLRPNTYTRQGIPDCCGIPDPPVVVGLAVTAVATATTTAIPYRTPVVSITPVSTTRRDDPIHTQPSVSITPVSTTRRDDPIRTQGGVSITAVAINRRDDPHVSIAGVSITAAHDLCPTAIGTGIGVHNHATIPAGGEVWYAWGRDRRVVNAWVYCDSANTGSTRIEVSYGIDCSDRIPLFSLNSPYPMCHTVDAGADVTYFFRLLNLGSTPAEVYFHLELTGCE